MSFTNSPLVEYTRLSPHNSGTRVYPITRITPHHVVGLMSVEALGAEFCGTRQASSNYGIGKDGRVALYVPESNRAWTSGSWDNDQRAVTIECADEPTYPYKFPDVVYNRLVELCADICRRNGKTKLVWISDKTKALAYQPKSNEMLLTLHKWLAATACPGKWLEDHMADLAEKVNAELAKSSSGGNQGGQAYAGSASTGSLTDEKTIWDYFMNKIGNAYGVAGLMGNLYAESALRSNNLQNTFESKLGYSDATYTQAVDNGSYANFAKDGAGYGLAQWTFSTRKQALLSYAHGKNKSIGDFSTQLDFLYKELVESYNSVISSLKSAKSVREASNVVLTKFEAPKDQGASVQDKRASYSEAYYGKYAGSGSAPRYGSRTLRKGMKGTDVKNMQEDLIKLGYDLSKYGADGDFGGETDAAVRKFQKDHGLVVDGVVGNATFAALASSLVASTSPLTVSIGDVVNFTGNKHYVGAYTTDPKACKPGKAKVTRIYKPGESKHPYHLVAVSGGGSTVCGWVDAGTFTKG